MAPVPITGSFQALRFNLCGYTVLGVDHLLPSGAIPVNPMPRRLITRRRLLAAGLAAVAVPATTTGYAWGVAPFNVQYHDLSMPIPGLPISFVGKRIVHLTDLHLSTIVPAEFIRSVIDRVNRDNPDYVVITGDLITNADVNFLEPVADLIATLKPPTIVSFGNHDYGVHRALPGSRFASQRWSIEVLTRLFEERRVITLRNASFPIYRGADRIWLVGLDDLWGGYFRPEGAFAQVPMGEPVIVLSHNPDTAPLLDEPYQPSWILAGHTHGGQVRLPFYGPLILPVRNKQYDQGLFRLRHAHMYVSRGVGYLRRMRFMCPPEVATFVLQQTPRP